jgi:hypothetical protein
MAAVALLQSFRDKDFLNRNCCPSRKGEGTGFSTLEKKDINVSVDDVSCI